MTWDNTDRDQLRNFLAQSKFIEYLRSLLPSVNATNFEEAALQARYKQGKEDQIKEIIEATVPKLDRKPTEEFVDVTKGLAK